MSGLKLFFSVLLGIFASSIFVPNSNATANKPRILYVGGSDLSNLTARNLRWLDAYRRSGMDTLLIYWPVTAPIEVQRSRIAAIRADAVLSQFKYILNVGDAFFIYFPVWLNDPSTANSPIRPYPGQLVESHPYAIQAIQKVTTIAQENPDLIGGYYSFDEPNQWDVSADIQESAYRLIRSLDSDIQNRPVYLAQTWPGYHPSGDRSAAFIESRLQNYYSRIAQDTLMSSEYSPGRFGQQRFYNLLRSHALLIRGVIPIMRAARDWDDADCSDQDLDGQLNAVISSLQSLQRANRLEGIAYYSFWPTFFDDVGPNSWTNSNYDASNCGAVRMNVRNSLQSLDALGFF